MNPIVAFALGAFIGFVVGILVVGVCTAAARADELAGTR